MSARIRIRNALAGEGLGNEIMVKGWVRTIRTGKEVAFLALNDGSCFANLQVVAEPGLATFADVCAIGTGAAVAVRGRLVDSPASGQCYELHADEVAVIGLADESYPLQKKRHSFEYLRSIAHLRPRSNTFGAVFRVRSSVAQAVHRFFAERGFLYVHTPIITTSDCEGAGEMFRVTTLDPAAPPLLEGEVDFSRDFFAAQAGLTVSGQLEGELFAQASAIFIPLAPPSGPRTPTPPATPPSSG